MPSITHNKKIENLIVESIPSLPPNQKRIAEYLLEHFHVAPLLSIQNMAKEASVSEASIVRFAQSLGFSGYKELKDELSVTLKNQLSPTERYKSAAAAMEKTPDILKLVAQNVIANINETIQSIDHDRFSQVVKSIMAAEKIYCLGLEISHHFAELMTFLLRLYTYDALCLSLNVLRFREQIAYFSPKDLLIAFSFSPYSRETVEALSYAKERGIPSIAFTDKKTAPIREHATYCIQIKTDNITFTNSLGAVAVVINALITELNFKDKERTLQALQIIEENIRDARYFITP